ncbi:MAG TPA: response regulator [Nocardioidaceae bacterium]|nr:response regulator [Nocardioidaceae bacterium]
MTDRARILLVDDRSENLLALEAILSSLNQVLVRATSGEEALRALLKDEYALILLDVQMPGMDGFETAAQIKARSRTRDIPIIFLTAVDTDERNAYRGYAAGGADYITKPFDPWVLRAKVQVFVDLWVAGRRLATQAELLRRHLGEDGSAIDVLGELRDRLAGVEDSVQALAQELKAGDGSPEESLAALERRVASMRQALDVLDGSSSVSGLTRREFG